MFLQVFIASNPYLYRPIYTVETLFYRNSATVVSPYKLLNTGAAKIRAQKQVGLTD